MGDPHRPPAHPPTPHTAGTRVRIVGHLDWHGHDVHGHTGTVAEVEAGTTQPTYGVRLDPPHTGVVPLFANEIEPVRETEAAP